MTSDPGRQEVAVWRISTYHCLRVTSQSCGAGCGRSSAAGETARPRLAGAAKICFAATPGALTLPAYRDCLHL